jgi:alginate O-acetyltransferase complex protein AlgI
MVFSDPFFLLGFLPASFLIFHLTRIYAGGTIGILVLVALSMAFYAYWSVPFLLILLTQIAINYTLGLQIERTRDRRTLTVAVIANLCLLGYFKYRNFFLENVGDVIGIHFYLTHLVVPLGISFHTFQQIALLIDLRKGAAKLPLPLNYVLFVLFFPQLIAGPIVLHQEMGKQVTAVRAGRGLGFEWVAVGALLLSYGLFKKVCLADSIAHYADIAFTPERALMMPEAWIGAIAFTLQLFFDFSGYSDMAVGLGLMFGFKLPNNFLVPYSACSITEFWQRWHITMMRFFTTYIYYPLWLRSRRRIRSSNYFQKHRSAILEFAAPMAFPTLVTFFLSGLWHGAGWTFICFGLVHGVGMVVNQTWKVAQLRPPPPLLGWTLTMLVVVIGAVYFRSNDLSQAHYIIHQMFWPSSPLSVPNWLGAMLPLNLPVGTFTLFSEFKDTVYCLTWTALLAGLSVGLPPLAANPQEIVPNLGKAAAMAAMTWLTIGFIGAPRTFLYFAF